jgi:hypothetical protein
MSGRDYRTISSQIGIFRPSAPIPFSQRYPDRGQNLGGKKDTQQSYKGMSHFKRINRPVDKSIWGPTAWDWLHKLTISFPDFPTESDINETNSRVLQFIEVLTLREVCKKFSYDYIKYHPIPQSKKEFQAWAWQFHNSINYRVGKKHFTLEEFDRKYNTKLSMKS